MRITSKGQVTIPAAIRAQAGPLPETEVEFEFDGKVLRIVRAKAGKSDSRGTRIAAHLRGRGDVPLNTDSIMALTRHRGWTSLTGFFDGGLPHSGPMGCGWAE